LKKPIIATKTMVISPHYLASMAGSQILQKGGNAFDAAVAVSACLAVVYPLMTGLGGDSLTIQLLKKAGHQVKVVKDFDSAMGHAQEIRIDVQGFLSGGVDPRGDGVAIGW
jgi:gamma-glutamyltranspeptidase